MHGACQRVEAMSHIVTGVISMLEKKLAETDMAQVDIYNGVKAGVEVRCPWPTIALSYHALGPLSPLVYRGYHAP